MDLRVQGSDWANLPAHLLDFVLDKLVSLMDYSQFSVVCMPWYKVAMDNKIPRSKMKSTTYRPPMLLISADAEDTWNVYNIMDKKVLNLQINLPNKRFCGSSKGWLITVEENFVVTLMNPFLKVKGRTNTDNSVICLPQLLPPFTERKRIHWGKHHGTYVIKAIISADPILDADHCVVMVIHQRTEEQSVAFIRLSKDTSWTYIDERFYHCDAIYLEHRILGPKFFLLSKRGHLSSITVTADSKPDVSGFFNWAHDDRDPNMEFMGVQKYLVDLNGEIFVMVERYYDFGDEDKIRTTKKFIVYEFEWRTCEWSERNTLRDVAIFLGDNDAVSVSASDYPNCEPNCIYFIRDWEVYADFRGHGPQDYGVYNLGNKTFSRWPFNNDAQSLLKMTSLWPVWVVPSFPL